MSGIPFIGWRRAVPLFASETLVIGSDTGYACGLQEEQVTIITQKEESEHGENSRMILVSLALVSVMAVSVAARTTVELTIATGGAGGPYHTIAVVGGDLTKNIPGINVTVASTSASVVNARMVHTGKAELAFAMSDVCFYAMRGETMFDAPLPDMVGLASVHTNHVQLITTARTGIKSVAQLKGKRVGVGAPGSGTELNARHVLKAAGMTYADLAKADYLSYAETCDQLANRNIDAGFLTGGLPIGAITELATKQDIVIIPIEPALVQKLQKEFPIYISRNIPAGAYKGVNAPVPTLAMKNYIVVNRNLIPTWVT